MLQRVQPWGNGRKGGGVGVRLSLSDCGRLRLEWRDSVAPHDHLFEAGCDHSTSGAICAYYNSDRVIAQSDCSSDSPSIDYGLIASGNQVIRDGVTRERLRKELNVLCSEMEAAGLMDNLW
jgi:nucleoside phosphorylase